jgi:geranylgeranyl diphosphate synthase type II
MLRFEDAQQIVNNELENYAIDRFPEELYEPVRYILSIGGKRLRPALVLMACSVFNDAVHKAIKPALAIEFFHNFTLLHDDIMDNSNIRRGHPTVHKRWDPNTAILSGDVMSILSYKIISESDDQNLKDLLQLFNLTALQVCEGQQYDMNFESRIDVSVGEYLKMIELKTAVLIAASLKAGAISGGAEMLDAELLYEFGRNLGMAFQIRDDHLDVYGDPQKFGKKIGNDIVTNKKTFLLIKALELSDPEMKSRLKDLLGQENLNAEMKIREVTNIYQQLGIDSISADLASAYYDKSLQYLERVHAEMPRKESLAIFAEKLMNREA